MGTCFGPRHRRSSSTSSRNGGNETTTGSLVTCEARSVTDDDVPAGVDFKDPERTALHRIIAQRVAEAGRARVIDAATLGILDAAQLHVLELGGGLLAETILAACDVERYVLLDHLDDFLDPAWPSRLEGPFDAIVSMQPELRHERRAQNLYAQA